MGALNSKNFNFIVAFVIILMVVGCVLFTAFQDNSSIYTKIFDVGSE